LIEICQAENEKCGKEAAAFGKIPHCYLESMLANQVWLVKNDLAGLPGATAITLQGEFREKLGEYSTLAPTPRYHVFQQQLWDGELPQVSGVSWKRLTTNA